MPTCGEAGSWFHLSFGLRCSLSRSCGVFEAGRRQERRALVLMSPLLHFHFGEKHGRSDGGDGNLAAFRAADTVEDVRLITSGENAGECGKRGADDVDATH